VPMGIVAFPKDSTVLLSRKIRVVIEVRGGKLDFARQMYHDFGQ